MGEIITEKIREAIADPDSIKVLATTDRHGEVHVVAKGSITVNEEGNIQYFELLEGSQTNKNVTYALWFKKKVSINVITKDKKSIQIKGIPIRSLVAGKEYEAFYVAAQEQNENNDLAAVYVIKPTEVREESYGKRYQQERELHPLYLHLDRIAKK